MAFSLKKLSPKSINKPPFLNLHQFYEFEFSVITQYETNNLGLYDQNKLIKTWSKHGADVYMLYQQKKPIGFAVINLASMLTNDTTIYDVAEFFVMPLYRKQGAGKWMATKIFNLYKGNWEIRQLAAAKDARRFWLKTIHNFTRGKFKEIKIKTKSWQGYVQQFRS